LGSCLPHSADRTQQKGGQVPDGLLWGLLAEEEPAGRGRASGARRRPTRPGTVMVASAWPCRRRGPCRAGIRPAVAVVWPQIRRLTSRRPPMPRTNEKATCGSNEPLLACGARPTLHEG